MGEKCKRKRVEIGGENFYLVVGENFITATVPAENRPDQKGLRNIVDTLCAEASKLMKGETE